MESLCEGDTSREQRHGRQRRPVRPLQLHVDSLRFHSGSLQHIAKPHAGPLRIADRSALPLHTGHFGTMVRASVSAALQDGGQGDGLIEDNGRKGLRKVLDAAVE